MNATSIALLKAIIESSVIGAQQVLSAATSDQNAIMNTNALPVPPVFLRATSDQNPSTNNAISNHKSDKEKERRDKTNKLFDELCDLVEKDGDGPMSQANILKAALKASIKHKREYHSDPRSRGLNAALDKVEQLTIDHLESLNLPHLTSHISVQNLKRMFEDFKDVVLPVFTSKAAPARPAPLPTSANGAPGAPTSSNAENARKEIKKNRELGRRDKLSEGFSSLKQFIDQNLVFSRGTQLNQVLEAIISFLKNTPTQQPSQEDDVEMKVGFSQGRKLGENVALQFFKKEPHLSGYFATLKNFFLSQLGSLDSPTDMVNFQFDKTRIMNFISIHPGIFNVPQAFTFWRPWEQKDDSNVHP